MEWGMSASFTVVFFDAFLAPATDRPDGGGSQAERTRRRGDWDACGVRGNTPGPAWQPCRWPRRADRMSG
ncbi:hypothetical protein GCM10022205_03330 [Spinactinospora alkalitolerans]